MAGMTVVRMPNPHSEEQQPLTDPIANGNRLSSTISSDPEKRDDMEIVDWDGPNDPENPYEQRLLLGKRYSDIV